MDAADITSVHDFTDEAIDIHNRTAKPEIKRGRCLYCNAQVPTGLYCDADCREDYETEQEIKAKLR